VAVTDFLADYQATALDGMLVTYGDDPQMLCLRCLVVTSFPSGRPPAEVARLAQTHVHVEDS
jgi:hypothetical protein